MGTVLGESYKDLITGFTGIATAKIQYMTGCEQTAIKPRDLKDGKPMDEVWFDDQKLVPSGLDAVVIDNSESAGADFSPPMRRG